MTDIRDSAPTAWNEHWDAMPNSVRALYATFSPKWLPFIKIEKRIRAWGQLCFDAAAARAVASHMYNEGMRSGWIYRSWRCEMDGPCEDGAKKSGFPPSDFSIAKYGPPKWH